MFTRHFLRTSGATIALVIIGAINALPASAQMAYMPITAASAKDVGILITLKPNADTVSSISFNADGSLLASGHKDGTIHLWDVEKQSDKTTLRGDSSEGAVDYVSFATGSTLLSLTEIDSMGLAKSIRIWDIATGDNTVFGLKNLTSLGLGGERSGYQPFLPRNKIGSSTHLCSLLKSP
ncbi:MAG TPA: hypothetical protein VKQ72_02000 [Aggregatilineales bacterium]|nr:hypothetical protein [Aggregatilineales bacterium]